MNEMIADINAYDEAKARIQAGEETIPSKVVYALLDGENPIRVWREYRGLTQHQLAERAGISKPYLSQLESGKRNGTTDVLKNLSQALHISIEDLNVSLDVLMAQLGIRRTPDVWRSKSA